MNRNEETKRQWRRFALGKLLVGTSVAIESLINSADQRYEFERPLVHESKIYTEKELKVWRAIKRSFYKDLVAMRKLGWHLQGKKAPGHLRNT